MTPCETCAECRWLRWDSRHEWCAYPSPAIEWCGKSAECENFEPARGERWAFVARTNAGIDPRVK